MSSADERLDGSDIARAGLLARRIAEAVHDAVEIRAEVLQNLLVCILAEGHVLIEDLPGVGKTTLARAIARLFVVLATQNPVEFEGTYPLPEAQVDRFMARLSLGYPAPAAEVDMLRDHEAGDRVERMEPVAAAADVLEAIDTAMRVYASDRLRAYIVALLQRTREDERTELGASPRAGLMLLRAAKARALLEGRDHALPDDVQALAEVVLSHRIVLAPEALEATGKQVVADALAATPAL
jgi:MoxR-like ATPase